MGCSRPVLKHRVSDQIMKNRHATISILALFLFSFFRLSAQLPGNSFKGIYMGTFSNGDQFALVVSKKTDASIFIVGTASRSSGTIKNFAIANDGSFSISQSGITINARISQNSVTGTVPSKAMTLSGSLVSSPEVGSGGYYFGLAIDPIGNRALTSFIVAGSRVFYYVEDASEEYGAVGTINSQLRITLTSATGVNGSADFRSPLERAGYIGTVNLLPFRALDFVIHRKDISYKLANLSVRSVVGTGSNTLIAGFVVSTGAKSVLIRAIGPTLSVFGVTGQVEDPKLSVFDSSQKLIAENDNWGSSTVSAAMISSAAASVGAFALGPLTKDSSLLLSLEAGSYTVQVSGVNGGTGVALVEVYEMN